MSAKSRSRGYVEFPIGTDDYIIAIEEAEAGDDGRLIALTKKGRQFVVTKARRYKRPIKVREITVPAPSKGSSS